MKYKLSLNKWLVVLVFAVLVLAFFWKTLFLGYVTIPADILKSWYPWHDPGFLGHQPHNTVIGDILNAIYPHDIIADKGIKNGDLALWNPYIFSGMPAMAAAHSFIFYPVSFCLRMIFSPLAVHQILIIFHLFLMGIAMYLLLRGFGLNRFPALIAGVIWMFNGYTIVWLGFKYALIGGALFPLLLLTFRKSLDENNYFYVLLSGIILALMLFTAFYIGYYVLIFLTMYLIFNIVIYYKNKDYTKIKKAITLFISTVALGAALAMVQLLPTLEFISFNQRPPRVLSAMFPHIWTKYLLLVSFFIPNIFGTVTSPNTFLFPGNLYNEFQGYMGVLPLILALFAVIYIRKKNVYFLGGMAILSLLLSLKTPLYLLFYYFIPGFNNLESGRILFLYAFCISVLAGFGIDRILSGKKEVSTALSGFSKFLKTLFILTLIGISVSNIFLYLAKGGTIHFIGSVIKTTVPAGQVYARLINNFNVLNAHFLIFVFIFGLSILLLSAYVKRPFRAGYFKFIAFGLITFDLFSYGLNYNTHVNPALVYPKMRSLELLEKDKTIFRVMSLNDRESSNLVMPFNSKAPYNIQDVGGYNVMYSRHYAEFMSLAERGKFTSKDEPFGYHYIFMSNPNSRLLDLLNVKYIITAPNKSLDSKRFELLYKDNIRIYRNNGCLPRVFITPCSIKLKDKEEIFAKLTDSGFDPTRTVILQETAPQAKCLDQNSSARIIDYRPGRVDIEAETEKGGYLILSDSYYPGWQAFIDGRKDKIYRADYVLRAVYIGPGRHKVEFLYKPASFIIGRNVSILTMLLVIGMFICIRLRGVAAGPRRS